MVDKNYWVNYYILNKDRMKENNKIWVNKRRSYIREYMRDYMKKYRSDNRVADTLKKDHKQTKLEPNQHFNIKFTYEPVIVYF